MTKASPNRLTRQGLDDAKRIRNRNRRLFLETLEDRRLLAADLPQPAVPLAEGEAMGLIVDNDDARGVAITGNWSSSAGIPGFFDADYLFSQASTSNKVTFTPTLPNDGKYEVSARWTSHPNRATNAPITVVHREGTFQTQVNQQVDGASWVTLGQFNLLSNAGHNVMVGASGVDGVVVADAIRFVRIGEADPLPGGAMVVDNDDLSGVTVAGNWESSAGIPGFFDADYLFSRPSAKNKVTFTPNLSGTGRYEVSVRWTSHPNRASNAPITVVHGQGVFATTVDQRQLGSQWNSLGEFELQAGSSNVMISAAGANGIVVADAVRFVPVSTPSPQPEISLLRGATTVPDGGTVEFGVTPVGSPIDIALVVRNDGNTVLNMTPLNTISLPAGYRNLSAAVASLQPGESANLRLQLLATSSGSFSGPVTIANNDANENPYNLTLRGTVVSSPSGEVILDNDDSTGVTIQGSWGSSTSVGGFFDTNYIFSAAAATANKVTFTPDLAQDGKYQVSARWTSHPNRATNAPITIVHRDGRFDTQVDQQENGGNWVVLGQFNLLAGVGHNVMVGAAAANGIVIADAVRFVRVGDADPPPQSNGEMIVDNDDPSGVQIQGFWESSSGVPGFVDADYLFSKPNATNKVTFTPAVNRAGRYEVSLRWTSHPNRASNVPVTVVHQQGVFSTTVNQRQSGGQWNLLGEFELSAGTSGNVMIAAVGADGVVVADAVRFVRVGDLSMQPEITVIGDGTEIDDGGTLFFGVTTLGNPVNIDLAIRNDGNQVLTLKPPSPTSIPAGFALLATPPVSSLLPGQATTLSLSLLADSEGMFSGSISIAHNDPDENPYEVNLRGTVGNFAPEITVLNGDIVVPDGGLVDFGTTTLGDPVDIVLRIRNDGDADLTLSPLDTTTLPVGYTGFAPPVSALIPGQATVLAFRLLATSEGTFTGPISIINGDLDENPYNLTLRGSVVESLTGPEITVLNGNTVVPRGSTLDFGTTSIGKPVDIELNIRNDGDTLLTLSPPPSASLPAGFAMNPLPVIPSLLPGQSTTLGLRLAATSEGTFSGPIAIGNNDVNENPFTLTLSGTVQLPAPEITVLRDGVEVSVGETMDFGDTQVGKPVERFLEIRNDGDEDLALGPLAAASLPQGFELISSPLPSTLAPGQSTTLGLRLAAAGGGIFSGSIAINNSDSNENPYTLRLRGNVMEPEITVLVAGTTVLDGGTVDFGETLVGSPADVTVRIRNDGSEQLTLMPLDTGTFPAGFTLISPPTASVLLPGQSTSLVLRMEATSEGTFSGPIAILNNDSNENPFDLNLEGSVRLPAPEITVLAGNQPVPDGGIVNFGTTAIGSPVDVLLHIRNDGEDVLTFSPLASNSLPIGFALLSTPFVTSLLPGETATSIVRMHANSNGLFSGPIALANNDLNENPYNLVLQGTVADNRYRGTATGMATIAGVGQVPVNEPVEFLVAGNQITVRQPNVGTGTVNESGTITFGIVSDLEMGNCSFTGAINAAQSQASGNWVCPALPLGGSASGTWQATRVAPGAGEGENALEATTSGLLAVLAEQRHGEPIAGDQPWPASVDRLFGATGEF